MALGTTRSKSLRRMVVVAWPANRDFDTAVAMTVKVTGWVMVVMVRSPSMVNSAVSPTASASGKLLTAVGVKVMNS